MIYSSHRFRLYRDAVIGIVAIYSLTLNLCIAEEKPSRPNLSGTISVFDRDGNVVADAADIVVFVDGPTKTQAASKSAIPIVTHKGRRFEPRVLPIVAGSKVNFFNDDSIFHNVFSLSKPNPFDLGIYPQNSSKFVTFPSPGLVKVFCNIHPKMISNILVLNNQYFSLTNTAGEYEISAVPPGRYSLRVWSELGDEVSKDVVIEDSETATIDFSVRQNQRLRKHRNKFGKPYKSKY